MIFMDIWSVCKMAQIANLSTLAILVALEISKQTMDSRNMGRTRFFPKITFLNSPRLQSVSMQFPLKSKSRWQRFTIIEHFFFFNSRSIMFTFLYLCLHPKRWVKHQNVTLTYLPLSTAQKEALRSHHLSLCNYCPHMCTIMECKVNHM